ncbi:hypothetical protein Aca07nite_64730 [Actinoplanes capillaceus]|uniref:HEAT repeat-containing protein n=1 Tax=Actinoplanes campanulatus TaxID=113559 RepID=A0ABQ3WSD2_9ACTN|nr:hypothetical protein [Actinoplanes capillaceus]GID49198.1 hypothetical protein Aca07nite_64730 [Actinoplanes capillaceus]
MTTPEDILATTAWGDLEDAYGSAEDLPGLLQPLLNGETADFAAAMHTLTWNLTHQGNLYSATLPAARYVVAVLTDPRTKAGKAAMLSWLNVLAGSAIEFEEFDNEPDADAVREAIPSFYPAVAANFEHTNPVVRVAARRAALTMLDRSGLEHERAAAAPHLLAEPELLTDSEQGVVRAAVAGWEA